MTLAEIIDYYHSRRLTHTEKDQIEACARAEAFIQERTKEDPDFLNLIRNMRISEHGPWGKR